MGKHLGVLTKLEKLKVDGEGKDERERERPNQRLQVNTILYLKNNVAPVIWTIGS